MPYNWNVLAYFKEKIYFKTYLHSDEIVVSKFDIEGRLIWQTLVPKLQLRDDDEYSGYRSIVRGNKLYLLYNDHPKNINISDPDEMKQMKNKFETTISEINLDQGSLIKYPGDTDNKKETIVFRKKYTLKSNQNRILVLDENNGIKLASFFFH